MVVRRGVVGWWGGGVVGWWSGGGSEINQLVDGCAWDWLGLVMN